MSRMKVLENAVAGGRILLSTTEKQIFDTLARACQFHQLPTILRVAGGWVRDKLLGLNSNDVDITLDTHTGAEFAKKVEEYLQTQEIEAYRDFHIVPTAEQSAHLEVATIKLHGLDVDINALRKEEYDPHSRIPRTSRGTLEDDVYRRDFTANTLYYNIMDDSVEDVTGLGLDDVRNGLIRTPIEPLKSFVEDPLRVLRAARFAGRLKFKVEADTLRAAQSREVRHALLSKVSRERFGAELDKLFKSVNPVASLSHMCSFGLYHAIFDLPASFVVDSDTHRFPFFPVTLHYIGWADLVRASLQIAEFTDKWLQTSADGQGLSYEERQKVLWVSFLSPLWGYRCNEAKKVTHRTLVFHVLSKSIRVGRQRAEAITDMLMAVEEFTQISREWIQELLRQPDAPHRSRLSIAGSLNASSEPGEAVDFSATETIHFDQRGRSQNSVSEDDSSSAPMEVDPATAAETQAGVGASAAQTDATATLPNEHAAGDDAQRKRSFPSPLSRRRNVIKPIATTLVHVPDNLHLRLGRVLRSVGNDWKLCLRISDALSSHFHAFVIKRFLPSSLMFDYIQASGLLGCWDWQPLLTGKDIAKDFGVKGPAIGQLMQKQIDYMLLNPGCSREECHQALSKLVAEQDCSSGGRQ